MQLDITLNCESLRQYFVHSYICGRQLVMISKRYNYLPIEAESYSNSQFITAAMLRTVIKKELAIWAT